MNELYHYGVLGMKWGVRRYQNADGSLTKAGYKHQLKNDLKKSNKSLQAQSKEASKKFDADVKELLGAKKIFLKEGRGLKRAGKITRKDYKTGKAFIRSQFDQEYEATLSKNLKLQYAIGQQQLENKAKYKKQIYGENSRRYKRAKAVADNFILMYGDYAVGNLYGESKVLKRADK